MRVSMALAMLILLTAIAANFAIPMILVGNEQDGCTFGDVSNARYLNYLRLAKAQLKLKPSLLLDGDGFSHRLDEIFSDLSRDEDTVYAKLAIMHATLRAAGAQYRNTNKNRAQSAYSNPFIDATKDLETVSFNYVLDVNGLGTFSPIQRKAWVIGSLAGPLYKAPPGPLYPDRIGALSFIVHPPDIEKWPADYDVPEAGVCPPVPSSNLADRFSSPSKTGAAHAH
jgi:hypothetical protein